MDRFLTQLSSAPGPYVARGMPGHGAGRQRRLQMNLHLDAPDLRPTDWTYPDDVPPDRGGGLTSAALADATRRLDSHPTIRTPGQSYTKLLNDVCVALNPMTAGRCDFFFQANAKVQSLAGRVWNVTTLKSLGYSFTGAGGAWKKAAYDWLTTADPSTAPLQPDSRAIGLCRSDSSFWLSDQSPFDFLRSKGITAGTEEAAWAVLQELALPGFETIPRRKDAMALVVVEFDASCLVTPGGTGRAWKPTAIDALNFKGYCFLPGKEPLDHGLTWPLEKSLRRHQKRDGLRELVHPHIRVPAIEGGVRTVNILGFLDADAKTEWDSLAAP